MANRKSSRTPTLHDDLIVVPIDDYGWTVIEGTRAQLIDEGFCTESHFPIGTRRHAMSETGVPPSTEWRTTRLTGGRWRFAYREGDRVAPIAKSRSYVSGAGYWSADSWKRGMEKLLPDMLAASVHVVDGTTEREIDGITTISFPKEACDAYRQDLSAAYHKLWKSNPEWIGHAKEWPNAKADEPLQDFLARVGARST